MSRKGPRYLMYPPVPLSLPYPPGSDWDGNFGTTLSEHRRSCEKTIRQNREAEERYLAYLKRAEEKP